MTITVEDGTLIEDANSYVSEADLEAFAAARGITLSTDTEILLIKAMDYIESLVYKGVKVESTQALQWPRNYVSIDGYLIDNDVIPNELKNGLMQTAVSIDADAGPQQTIGRQTIKEKVGELEIQYAPGSVLNTIDPKINSFLWKLLTAGGSGGNILNVYKG